MEERDNAGTIADRFAIVRSRSGLSRKDFAASLGIHPVVAGDIELGKREPSRDVLVRLVQAWGVDISWLLTGIPARPEDSSGAGAVRTIPTVDPVRSAGEGMVEIRLVHQAAAAGRGVEIDDYPEISTLALPGSFIAPKRPDRVLALKVRGDSMIGIGIDDGDLVFFATDECAGDGIHVVSIGSQLLVKRIQLDPAGRRVQVLSENPRYGVRILEGPDLESFRIEGRVIACLHRY